MTVSIHGRSPIAGWFIMEHPIKMNIEGYPYGLETPICLQMAKKAPNGTFNWENHDLTNGFRGTLV